MFRRHVAIGVYAVAAVLWAGCATGHSTTPVGPTTTAPAGADSAPTESQASDQLPAGFPVPPGIIGSLYVWNDAEGVGATCGVSSGTAAYDFYRSALPAAGYTITKVHHLDGSDGGRILKRIDFSGNGYNGTVLFGPGIVGRGYDAGDTVDIDLKRS